MSALTSRPLAARLVKQSVPDPALAGKAQAEAARLVEGARAEAARILDNARAEANRLTQDAAAGGRTAAESAAASALLQSRQALDAELIALRPTLAAVLRDALHKTVGECCGEDTPGRILGRALDDLSAGLVAEVTANPRDMKSAERALGVRPGRVARLVADAALPPGRVRLAAAGITMELGLDRTLALFETVLADA